MNRWLGLSFILLLTSCNSKVADLDRISPIDFFLKQFGAESETFAGQYQYDDFCNDSIRDKFGNIYCAGATKGHFADTHRNPGTSNQDILIVKMDQNGKMIWATQLGETNFISGGSALSNANDDVCYGTAVDEAGNVYCAGRTSGPLAGPGSNPSGTYAAFVLKLDSLGNILWVRMVQTTGQDYFQSIAIAPNGDLIAAGSTGGELVAGEGTDVNNDAIVTRMTKDGAIVWTRQLGDGTLPLLGRPTSANDSSDLIVDILANKDGNISLAGQTSGSLGESSAGANDFFLWRLDSNGNSLALKQYGAISAPFATASDKPSSFIADESGALYWGGRTGSNFASTSAGAGDALVMKTTASGEIIWKTQLGSSALDECSSLAVNQFSLYCIGYTEGSLAETKSGFNGVKDIFLLKLNLQTGVREDLIQLGAVTAFPHSNNENENVPTKIFADERDRLYVTGHGVGEFGESNSGITWYDIFVFKLDDNHRPSDEER